MTLTILDPLEKQVLLFAIFDLVAYAKAGSRAACAFADLVNVDLEGFRQNLRQMS